MTIVYILKIVVALILVGLSFTKFWTDSKVRIYIQMGIDFANTVGGTNRDKLVRAVTYIENKILNKVPVAFRPMVDFMINAEKIATLVERQLTSNKTIKKYI